MTADNATEHGLAADPPASSEVDATALQDVEAHLGAVRVALEQHWPIDHYLDAIEAALPRAVPAERLRGAEEALAQLRAGAGASSAGALEAALANPVKPGEAPAPVLPWYRRICAAVRELLAE